MVSPQIPDAARAMIGKETALSEPFIVTRDLIARFLESVEDKAVSAPSSPGSDTPDLVAPLGLLADVVMGLRGRGEEDTLDVPLPTAVSLGGTEEFEFLRPVKAGEAIRFKRKLLDVYTKAGRSGQLYFVVTEITFYDQAGQIVAKKRDIGIRR